jgi:hypothetical protein
MRSRGRTCSTERTMTDMKERVSLSLDGETASYLTAAAARETGGNVSALVDRIVRKHALQESLRREAKWYADNPSYAEDAETERYEAGAA